MRTLRLLAVAVVLAVIPAALAAAPPEPPLVEYSKATFTAAQAAGLPIVVFVHASWCVTCRLQEPIVRQLAADPAFAGKKLFVFVVDYDDKSTLQELKLTDRSTLVAFRGKVERARSSFSTDAGEIRALFSSAL